MPDEAEPFGLVFWKALERQIAERIANNLPPPTKEERMKLCTELHEKDVERRLAVSLRASAPASGLFYGVAESSPKRARQARLADDETWLRELESDPLYAGLNIRQQLGMCQRWCREHSAQPTRRRFTNWLNNALADKPIQASSRPAPKGGMNQIPEPTGWRVWVDNNRPESLYASGQPEAWKPWDRIDRAAQEYIISEMRKQNLT